MEKGKRAADEVVDHLNRYGFNARVLILTPDARTLVVTCIDGPEGLFKHYGEQFPGSEFSAQMFQTNHEKGGQVLGMTATDAALGKHRQQVYTLVWVENAEEVGPAMVKSARSQLRTSEFITSLGGITV